MKNKIIAVIGLDYLRYQFIKAINNIDFIEIKFFDKNELKKEEVDKTIKYIKENIHALIVGNIAMDEGLNISLKKIKEEINEIPIIPIGVEMLESNFLNIDMNGAVKINRYFSFGGFKNINNALKLIIYNFLNMDDTEKVKCDKVITEPEYIPFDGIFHRDTNEIFDSFKSYIQWYVGKGNISDYKWIGILTHRHNWINGNIEVEKMLIREFEAMGFKVVPVFSYASAGNKDEIKNFDSVIRDYFSIDGKVVIEGLVNFQMIAAVGNSKEGNIFMQGVKVFKEIDIPIFRPLISFRQDEKTWSENKNGLSMEIPWSFTTPEMMGMIEPIIVGCRDKTGKSVPIDERIKKFVKRASKCIELRHTVNKEKRIAIVIHNAPCSGVEATIGLGAGLNVFESILRILNELKANGYKVKNIPENGQILHKMIMTRKAYHDFRWTSVEDIINAGGAIYQMSLNGDNGYMKFYNNLDEEVHKEIEESWGKPPGEGMVYENKIVITGVNFGNVTLMVQPKRGCYGAKCTGEVCKILHDPKCPPPHQYIATYKYIEEILKANAVVHVGTGGSLEHLPGKTNALSNKCYPDIVLGTTPNIYIYNAGIGTEGIGAKRRNNAVIIDYLPSCITIDPKNFKLTNLIGEYLEAVDLNSNQKDFLKENLKEKIKEIQGAEEIVKSENSFTHGLKKLKDYLVQSICSNKIQDLHILGEIPELKERISFVKEHIDNNSKNAAIIKNLCENKYIYNVTITELIAKFVVGNDRVEAQYSNIDEVVLNKLKLEVLDVYNKLFTVEFEIKNLIKALEGGFIEPGLSGMPCENLKNILPTGRNFYLLDCEKIPTREAYEVGCKLADMIIERYQKDEGKFPEKIAMNMISTDISMAKGEQLSQILSLMGIIPIWDESGKVIDLEVIPLEKLNRPRIDVTVRISGVLRDSYPQAISLIDKAVILASSLDEPISSNFIKKNTLEIERVLNGLVQQDEIKRRSTIRVFGDKPGTYGAGVDLALKASAWKCEEDIAKVFVYFSSYAYGEKLNGCMAKHEFVENVKGSDISYETTISNRYDVLSCSFAASVQGGFGAVKNALGINKIKQYHGSTEDRDNVRVSTLKEEIKKNLDSTFFNPLWKENVKKNGYTGASDFMRMVQSVFSWQSLSENIDDKDLDKLVEMYVNDEKMLEWFNKHNKYAVEEISRRFLELYERKKWNPDKDILYKLRKSYIKIEGDMEELLDNSSGDIQGGDIEVLNQEDIKEWNSKLSCIEDVFIKP